LQWKNDIAMILCAMWICK